MKISALILCSFLSLALPALAEECGTQVPGLRCCPNGRCCSQWGWCGDTEPWCGVGCQSNCWVSNVPSDFGQLISKQAFERMMLLHGNGRPNTGVGYDIYEAFITAATSFPSFGNTGTIETRKREVATFLAQTLHGIAGNGWQTESEAVSYFTTAILSWMTPKSSKPSHHEVMMKQGNSTSVDTNPADHLPGYVAVRDIISGGLRSGNGYDAKVAERIDFYMKYADILGVGHDN